MFFFIIFKTQDPEASRRTCEYREICFLKACVNKDTLHAFQSKFFPSESTQMAILVYYDENLNIFKRVDTIKTCVAVFGFSRKISGSL